MKPGYDYRLSEEYVLGAMFLQEQAFWRVADIITTDCFNDPTHRLMWEGIAALARAGKAPEPFLMEEYFAGDTRSEVPTIQYMMELFGTQSGVASVRDHAQLLVDRRDMYRVHDAAEAMRNLQGHGVYDQAVALLGQAAPQQTNGPRAAKAVLNSVVAQMEERLKARGSLLGASYSLHDVDKLTSGMGETDLMILAARPSMGKTALAMQMARHVAKRGDRRGRHKVLVLSMEMDAEALMMRLISAEGRVDHDRVRNPYLAEPEEMQRIQLGFAALKELPLFIDDTPSLTAEQAVSRITQEHMKGELALVVIDYLQFFDTSTWRDNVNGGLQEVTRQLKALAKRLRVPVLLLSQLSRSLEKRTDKRPIMSDLRDSGAIEQDADVVAFIYRDDYYNPASSMAGTAEIILRKVRNGRTGTAMSRCELQYLSFHDLAGDDMAELEERIRGDRTHQHKAERSVAGFDADA